MRLLPRRRREKTGDARPNPDLPAERTAPETTPQPAGRAAGPAHWRRLAPLDPTVRRAPMTVAGTMGVFADERNRPLIQSLIHTPGSRFRPASPPEGAAGNAAFAGRAGETGGVEPAAGRVSGLIVVRDEAPSGPEPSAQPPAPERKRIPAVERTADVEAGSAPAPARLVPRVLESAGPRPSLVKAADEYVGAPEPAEAPYASSAWLRMIESYRPPWAGGAAAAPPGTPVAPPPIPEGGGSWSSETATAPPRTAPAAPTDTPRPARRASLAESRRLGLGSPLRRPSSQTSDSEDAGLSDAPAAAEPAADRSAVPDEPEAGGGHARLAHPQTPAIASTPAPETTARPAADVGDVTDSGESPRPAPESPARSTDSDTAPPSPRLGLAAPIERPVRRSRDTSSGSRPTLPRMPSPPPQEDPQPGPQAAGGAAQEAASPTEGLAEPALPTPPHPALPHVAPPDTALSDAALPDPALPHPVPPARAVPVYRFVPGERPTQGAVALPRPMPPAPAATPPAPGPAPAPGSASSASPSAAGPLPHPGTTQRADSAGTEGTAQSQARYSGPVQPQQPASTRAPEPTRPASAPRVTRREQTNVVPYQLLEAVRRVQGVDVSDVPIRRGPEVADEARLLGAHSFTRGGEVFLPAHAGPTDEPVARGLLAHELTHAAQQRVLGPSLPAEDSHAGRALEAQAVAAERWARGVGEDPGALGGASSAPAASWTAPWISAPSAGVQRQAEDVMSAPAPEDGASAPSAGPSAAPAADSQAQQGDEEMDAARGKLLELSKRRPLDLDDPADIEELSTRIYQRIHRRLRRDLVVDRERAGRLGETGPFGAAR